MKRTTVERLLAETVTQIKYTQIWNEELRANGKAKEINEMKLHYLDGRREAFEELLKEEGKQNGKNHKAKSKTRL